MSNNFELAFQQASSIVASIPGYTSYNLRKCIEKSDRAILMNLRGCREEFRAKK